MAGAGETRLRADDSRSYTSPDAAGAERGGSSANAQAHSVGPTMPPVAKGRPFGSGLRIAINAGPGVRKRREPTATDARTLG